MPSVAGAPPRSPHRVLTGQDRGAVLTRFEAVNRERLRRVRATLGPRQAPFLELLAFLFHANHPMLPGFVSTETPTGVSGYSPGNATLRAAKRVAKSLDYRRRIPKRLDIDALFIMGSAGTIAYSRKSDFDVWVCHREDLSAAGTEQLRGKCEGIQTWAEDLGLEVHFFPVRARELRSGHHAGLSAESSGSAQHHLLLDEFYRTALHIAGRYPLWWLVPPDHETEYDAYAARLLRQRFVRAEESIDLGGLPGIPASEFLGASLWQLYKAIGAPNKSFLKILLLEAYAREHPRTELLSHRYKRAVYQGHTQPREIDPYLMMLSKVEGYLNALHDDTRLQLARQSFYLKVNQPLSDGRWRQRDDVLLEHLAALTRSWGWDERRLRELDRHAAWRVEQVQRERALQINGLMASYRALSELGRERQESARISEADLDRLGRRLFAAFERRAGKLDLINPDATHNLGEPQLRIQRLHAKGQEAWLLFRIDPRAQLGPDANLLKRAPTLVELIAWGHFNGVIQRRSHIDTNPDEGGPRPHELGALREAMARGFPPTLVRGPSIEAMTPRAWPVTGGVFVNIGVNPFAEYARRGEHLTSERRDPLSYGSRRHNLVLTLDYLYVTSWSEVLCFHYRGVQGLLACVMEHLRLHSELPDAPRPTLSGHCYTPDHGANIAARVEALFDDVTKRLLARRPGDELRYLVQIGRAYYVLALGDAPPHYHRCADLDALLRRLGRPSDHYSEVVLDRHCECPSALRLIFETNRPGRVQVFFHVQGDRAALFVVDERGSMCHDRVPFHSRATLLAQLGRFFDKIHYRESAAGQGPGYPVDFHEISRDARGHYRLSLAGRHQPTRGADFLDLQVIVRNGDGRHTFLIYYDGEELSSLEHGEALFEVVARHIVSHRPSRATYPIYITDIDLSDLSLGRRATGGIQTIYYLKYKKRIEQRINAALGGVVSGMAGSPSAS